MEGFLKSKQIAIFNAITYCLAYILIGIITNSPVSSQLLSQHRAKLTTHRTRKWFSNASKREVASYFTIGSTCRSTQLFLLAFITGELSFENAVALLLIITLQVGGGQDYVVKGSGGLEWYWSGWLDQFEAYRHLGFPGVRLLPSISVRERISSIPHSNRVTDPGKLLIVKPLNVVLPPGYLDSNLTLSIPEGIGCL